MLQSVAAATDLDLISYLKAIPDARMRRGVRIPAWYLLLVAVLGILSKCESLRDLERFARRHHAVRNGHMRWPSRTPRNATTGCRVTSRSITGSGSTQPSATGHLSSASVSCSADQRGETKQLGKQFREQSWPPGALGTEGPQRQRGDPRTLDRQQLDR